MPWYYTGPDSKPVGPLTLQELQARRSIGTISAETFVIEDTGQRDANWTWKRYREVFPSSPTLPMFPPLPSATLPPMPPIPGMPPVPQPIMQPPLQPPPVLGAPPVPIPVPIPVPTPGQPSVFTSPHGPDPFYTAPVRYNEWCAWGGGLGIASLPLLALCFLGALVAPISLIMCIVGLVQVGRNHVQLGRGLAITGLIISVVSIALSIWALTTLPQLMNKAAEEAREQQQANE